MCTHLPDLHLVKPFFYKGELVCFMWDFIHAADVGGITPGSAPPSTFDVFQEGVRIPPSKLFKRGKVDDEVKNFLLANTRVPHDVWGDIKALVAALNSAERRLAELADRYGIDVLKSAILDVLDYGEARARAIIEEIPDGSYSFVDYIEGYPGDGMPFRIELKLTIDGSDVLMDFTGTDLQMPSSYNIPTHGKLNHFLTFGLVSYIRSRDPSCPLNSGIVRPIRVEVPRGTLLNPEPGASCSVRFVTAERVLDVVMGALAQTGAPLIPAAGGGCVAPILFPVLDPKSGRYKMGILQMLLGGMGGRAALDGVDGVDFSNAFFRNGPNEMAEAELPVLVRRYGWATSTVPAGEHRGGLGVVYEVESLSPHAVMTARCMERERFRPWGRHGGDAGTLIRSTLHPGTDRENELGKVDVLHLGPGDRVRIEMPSGGGYGPAVRRSITAIEADLRDGILGRDKVEADYAVRLDGETVDPAATATLRANPTPAPTPIFTFGPERDAYERVFPQELQRRAVEMLLKCPAAARRHLRDRLWTESVKPALEQLRPLDKSEFVAKLDGMVAQAQRMV
jgi:N-methylhydantoinase B